MSAAPSRSFPHSLRSHAKGGMDGAEKSLCKALDQSSARAGVFAGQTPRDLASGAAHARARDLARRSARAVQAADFRDWFLPQFARWLQANFDDPEHVARLFEVRYRTALNWWNAEHCASGDTVALAFLTFPQAVGWFLAEWERAA